MGSTSGQKLPGQFLFHCRESMCVELCWYEALWGKGLRPPWPAQRNPWGGIAQNCWGDCQGKLGCWGAVPGGSAGETAWGLLLGSARRLRFLCSHRKEHSPRQSLGSSSGTTPRRSLEHPDSPGSPPGGLRSGFGKFGFGGSFWRVSAVWSKVATSSSMFYRIIRAGIGVFCLFGSDESHGRVQYFGHNHPFPPPNLKKTQKSRHYTTLCNTILPDFVCCSWLPKF